MLYSPLCFDMILMIPNDRQLVFLFGTWQGIRVRVEKLLFPMADNHFEPIAGAD